MPGNGIHAFRFYLLVSRCDSSSTTIAKENDSARIEKNNRINNITFKMTYINS